MEVCKLQNKTKVMKSLKISTSAYSDQFQIYVMQSAFKIFGKISAEKI